MLDQSVDTRERKIFDRLSDEELAVYIKENQGGFLERVGDAFAVLVKRYYQQLLNLAYRFSLDDPKGAVQDVFFQGWQNIGKYRPSKGKFAAWLKRVARNHFINVAKKQRRAHEYLQAEPPDSQRGGSNTALPDGIVENLELKSILRDEIHRLPDKHRHAIQRRYYDDYTLQEIADEIGTSIDTVRRRIHKAHEMLKKRLLALL